MVNRSYNFYAGPATLPLSVLEQAQAEFLDYKGTTIQGPRPIFLVLLPLTLHLPRSPVETHPASDMVDKRQ